MDTTKITNIKVEGIDHRDYPDFCDAFISSADYEGEEMTEFQIDELNENSDFIHQCVMKQIF